MFRRRPPIVRRRPGLLGTMARTAVIAGTASATAGAVQHRANARAQAQAEDLQEQQQIAEMQQQLAGMQAQSTANAMQPPTPAPSAGGNMVQQLQQLTDMKSQGLLSDEEFNAAKAKLLGG